MSECLEDSWICSPNNVDVLKNENNALTSRLEWEMIFDLRVFTSELLRTCVCMRESQIRTSFHGMLLFARWPRCGSRTLCTSGADRRRRKVSVLVITIFRKCMAPRNWRDIVVHLAYHIYLGFLLFENESYCHRFRIPGFVYNSLQTRYWRRLRHSQRRQTHPTYR